MNKLLPWKLGCTVCIVLTISIHKGAVALLRDRGSDCDSTEQAQTVVCGTNRESLVVLLQRYGYWYHNGRGELAKTPTARRDQATLYTLCPHVLITGTPLYLSDIMSGGYALCLFRAHLRVLDVAASPHRAWSGVHASLVAISDPDASSSITRT